jgi:hypothetical protein
MIQNKAGRLFRVYLYADHNVGMQIDDTDFNKSDVTPEQLRDELVKFLA